MWVGCRSLLTCETRDLHARGDESSHSRGIMCPVRSRFRVSPVVEYGRRVAMKVTRRRIDSCSRACVISCGQGPDFTEEDGRLVVGIRPTVRAWTAPANQKKSAAGS